MERVLATEASLSLTSLQAALKRLGGTEATLAVTRADADLAMGLAKNLSMVGGPYVMVDYCHPLPNRDAWYVERGDLRVWGSKGD